jgi:hypothetical protein
MYYMKILLLFLLSSILIFPQCSDAGICSLGGQESDSHNKNLRLGLGYQYGYSSKTDEITYNSIGLDGKYSLNDFTLTILLPFNHQTGPLGNVSGIGDLLLTGSYNLLSGYEIPLNIHGGVKLATGNDNKGNLPQAYQSGLGSNDILIGISSAYNNMYVLAGYQIAGGRNDNIQQVKRGDDLLFSVGYNQNVSENFTGGLELLLIKRLDETSIVDPALPGNFISVPESDNLQINGALTLLYMVSENLGVNFFGAIPFRQRPVNIDGLTRSITLAGGIYFML